MASWRRRLAESLGAAAGVNGSWGRRYADGLGAITTAGSWMRRAAFALGSTAGPGSWDRRLRQADGSTPEGAGESWDAQKVEESLPPGNPTGGGGFTRQGATAALSATVALADVSGISLNSPVSGPGIAVGSVVLAIDPLLKTVTLSIAATQTALGVSLFFTNP